MIRLAPLLLSCVVLAGSFGPAESATLRTTAMVSDGQIRLGDLFDGLDSDLAERAVAAAPEPGRRLSLDPAALSRIAAAHRLEWRPVTGADRVMVERASFSIGPDRIQEALSNALADAGVRGRMEVALDNRTLTLHLPAGTDDMVVVENLAYDPARSRLTAELFLPGTGQRQTVGARAVEVVDVPVLNRRMMPGEVISQSDLDWTTLQRDRTGADTVLSAAELVGQTVRRNVTPHRPVRAGDVRAPVVVPRGAVVTILLQTPSMTLTAQGRALSDGAHGEVIRVTNTASNRTVEARVAGDGLVTVVPAGMAVGGAVGTPVANPSSQRTAHLARN